MDSRVRRVCSTRPTPGIQLTIAAPSTGTIPPELSSLTNLRELYLSYNQLQGEFIIELCFACVAPGLHTHTQNQLRIACLDRSSEWRAA